MKTQANPKADINALGYTAEQAIKLERLVHSPIAIELAVAQFIDENKIKCSMVHFVTFWLPLAKQIRDDRQFLRTTFSLPTSMARAAQFA